MGRDHEVAGAQETPAAATGVGPAAPGRVTLLSRVIAATHANDAPALIAIEGEARQRVHGSVETHGHDRHGRATTTAPTTSADDTTDAAAALARARGWAMDHIAGIRRSYANQLGALHVANPADGQATPALGPGAQPAGRSRATMETADAAAHTSQREAIEATEDAQCTPYLDVLTAGDEQHRYEHPRHDPIIEGLTFDAVRLHAMRRGVGQEHDDEAAHAEASSVGRVGAAAWCGAFAYTQQHVAGNMDSRWVGDMQGTGGIVSALHYGHTGDLYVWSGSQWKPLRAYHEERGSLRRYELVDRTAPSISILAGDLCLIDNRGGTNPDHITTVIAFDGRYLTLIGGNQGSGDSAVSRSGHVRDLSTNPQPYTAPAAADGSAGFKTGGRDRIHGIGRWSVVDYERRVYQRSAAPPTTPPSPELLAQRA
ncbi:MAG TPA: hypothetical protein VGM88_10735 [Kofleriaceae bacterium]|jgi:hypothetical protein